MSKDGGGLWPRAPSLTYSLAPSSGEHRAWGGVSTSSAAPPPPHPTHSPRTSGTIIIMPSVSATNTLHYISINYRIHSLVWQYFDLHNAFIPWVSETIMCAAWMRQSRRWWRSFLLQPGVAVSPISPRHASTPHFYLRSFLRVFYYPRSVGRGAAWHGCDWFLCNLPTFV